MASPPARPAVGSPAFLDSAVFLTLDLTPRHPDAWALVEVLTERVLAHEADPLARGNQRRAVGLAKLRQAVSGIVGGLLRAWWHKAACRPVWRSNQAESFTPRPLGAAEPGGPDEAMDLVQGVGRRSFRRVIEVLQAEGLLEHRGGVRLPRTHRFRMGRGGQGKSARYWPTAALLVLAQAQGLTPGSIAAAFRAPAPTRLPKLPMPIQLRPLRAKAWDALPLPSGRGLPPGDTDPHARHDGIRQVLVTELAEQNTFARSIPVQFPAEVACYPPQWHRVFYGSWALQGRWYATGVGGDPELGQRCAYSSLKPDQRAGLRIDGEPVVELDVSASHLTLLLGLAGAALPDGDPYVGLGLPRPVVKQWVMELCGKGQPPARWSRRLAADHPARAHAVKAVGAVVLARYPALRQAATVVPAELALQLERPSAQLVTHFLAAREAVAMSQAIRQLRLQGILALPVYDSLIVPAEAETAARQAIAAGYVAVCGLVPRIQRKTSAAAPEETGDPAG